MEKHIFSDFRRLVNKKNCFSFFSFSILKLQFICFLHSIARDMDLYFKISSLPVKSLLVHPGQKTREISFHCVFYTVTKCIHYSLSFNILSAIHESGLQDGFGIATNMDKIES